MRLSSNSPDFFRNLASQFRMLLLSASNETTFSRSSGLAHKLKAIEEFDSASSLEYPDMTEKASLTSTIFLSPLRVIQMASGVCCRKEEGHLATIRVYRQRGTDQSDRQSQSRSRSNPNSSSVRVQEMMIRSGANVTKMPNASIFLRSLLRWVVRKL